MKITGLGSYQTASIAFIILMILWWQASVFYQSQLILDKQDQVHSHLVTHSHGDAGVFRENLDAPFGP